MSITEDRLEVDTPLGLNRSFLSQYWSENRGPTSCVAFKAIKSNGIRTF